MSDEIIYLTPTEVADYVKERSKGVISVTPTCVRLWCNDYPDLATKFAGRWKINKQKLDDWLQLSKFDEVKNDRK